MNKMLPCVAIVVGVCVSNFAIAGPVVWYAPVSGSILFQNDHTGPLANASIVSTGGKLKSAADLLDINGAIKDNSELPFAFTYLGLPVGQSFAGYIVTPGTPHADLQFQYRLNSLLEPLITSGMYLIPEPSTCLLALAPVVALFVTARAARRS